MRFEALEQLCEGKMTQELAASIYEQMEFNKVQFRVKNRGEKIQVVDILNHFYVKGMSVERSENGDLRNYRIV